MLPIVLIIVLALAAALPAPAADDQGPIAFTGVHWSKNSVRTAIYVIRADGTHQRKLADGGLEAAWSRDGRRIAFERESMLAKRLVHRLVVMNADGSNPKALTKPLVLAESPSWSPDGKRIAFTWMGNPSEIPANYAAQVAIVSSSGGKIRLLTAYSRFKGGTGAADWSADGKRILFEGFESNVEGPSDIWSVRPDGSGLKRLIRVGIDPVWSPDGSRIAFSRRGDIYIARATGHVIRRLTNTPKVRDQHPSWSADGKRIVYASYREEKNDAKSDSRLSIIGADGSGLRTITDRDPRFWADGPAWRP